MDQRGWRQVLALSPSHLGAPSSSTPVWASPPKPEASEGGNWTARLVYETVCPGPCVRVSGAPSVPTGSWSAAVGESAVWSAAWSAAALVRGQRPGGGRNDLYEMVQVLNTHLPRLSSLPRTLSGRNIRNWRTTAKPAIWKSV